jgi:hypothetical protein
MPRISCGESAVPAWTLPRAGAVRATVRAPARAIGGGSAGRAERAHVPLSFTGGRAGPIVGPGGPV